jgi:DNA-binding IclR family transcriptional regulator
MSRQRGPRGQTGPVVSRVLHMLGAFTLQRPAMTLSELSRQAGVPLSTAHRMVNELVEWGALERAEDGCYRIGLRLWELGALAPRGPGLRERALPYLEDLCQVTRENVQLAVREGREIVFVERIAGSSAVPVFTRLGGRLPTTATGVGLVLLAHAPVEIQDEVLAGTIERFTPHTVTDPRRLRRMLADVRTQEFIVSDRQLSEEAVSVAAPVRDDRRRVVAAVSLVVRYPTSTRLLVPPLLTSARAITRAISGSVYPPNRMSLPGF